MDGFRDYDAPTKERASKAFERPSSVHRCNVAERKLAEHRANAHKKRWQACGATSQCVSSLVRAGKKKATDDCLDSVSV